MIERLESERGTTLIETSIATAILLVVTVGLLGMSAVATTYTENHGHLEARTTEYAQDKMEQLLALAYTDAVSDTTVFPAATSGGSGLAVGGSATTSAPENHYVDWLSQDGTLLGGGTAQPATWFYERVWQISQLTTGVKQIKVTVVSRTAIGGAILPTATVVALKSSQL